MPQPVFILSIAAAVCFGVAALTAVLSFHFERFGHGPFQFIAAAAGFALKTAGIGVACALSTTHFFNSTSEIIGLMGWALGFGYLLSLVACRARSLGVLMLPLIALLLGASVFHSGASVDPGVPSDRLLAAHILSAFLGYGLFLTACGASILYLAESRLLKRKLFGPLFRDMPSLVSLERLALLCVWIGFGLLTVTILTGGRMAEELHKPFWLDPKAIGAQVTWLVFAILAVSRAVHRLQGRVAAWCVLAGALLIVATFALNHPFGRPVSSAEPATRQGSGRVFFRHGETQCGAAAFRVEVQG